jgi:hypothetical protein
MFAVIAMPRNTLGDKLDEIACAGPAPPFERQPDRHARRLAGPALDRDVAPMQMHQALDDRQPKPRVVTAMFTGGTRLEESFSQTRPQGALMRRHNSIPA